MGTALSRSIGAPNEREGSITMAAARPSGTTGLAFRR